jgi:hypothetical protein
MPCTGPAASTRARCGARQRAGRLQGHGDPPLDLLPVEASGAPVRSGDPAAQGAAPAEDGQPDIAVPRAARARLRARSPRFGPDRISAELRREKWGGIVLSPNGVHRVLARHGLSTRAKRLGLVAGYAAPPEPERRPPAPQRHLHASRPGEMVQLDCFFIGRLSAAKGAVWQYTAIDVASAYCWAELHLTPRNPSARGPPSSRAGSRPTSPPGLVARAGDERQRERVPV